MAFRIILTMIFTALGTVCAILSIGLTCNWGSSPWLFAEGWFQNYISNFTFQRLTVDTWVVFVPMALGALLFLLNLIVSIVRRARRLLIPFVLLAFAGTVWATYVYAATPAPMAMWAGILSYASIIFAVLGQAFALGSVE